MQNTSLNDTINPLYAAAVSLTRYWDLKIPVDPALIAKKMGISAFYSDKLGKLSSFYDAVSKKILISEHESKTYQRFAVAHELGHAVLGHGTIRGKKRQYSLPKEQAANSFAAALLMPEIAVRTMVEQRGLGFKELCKTFDVSEEMMGRRLIDLRIV